MREVDSTGTLKTGEKALADLRKRKLIVQRYFSYIPTVRTNDRLSYRKGQWFTVHKSQQFSTSTAKPETDLTVDMLTSYAVPIFFLFSS